MDRKELLERVAPCGMNCGDCPPFKAKFDESIREYLLAKGYPAQHIPCPGCRTVEGHCPHFKSQCGNYSCAMEHKVEFCHECPEFPCVRLHPAADRAAGLPHNMKMYNLCLIKRIGLEEWYQQADEIKRRYYQGIISYGDGPQLPK